MYRQLHSFSYRLKMGSISPMVLFTHQKHQKVPLTKTAILTVRVNEALKVHSHETWAKSSNGFSLVISMIHSTRSIK